MKRLRFVSVNGSMVTNVPVTNDNVDVVLDPVSMSYRISSTSTNNLVDSGSAKNYTTLQRLVRNKLIELGAPIETETRKRSS